MQDYTYYSGRSVLTSKKKRGFKFKNLLILLLFFLTSYFLGNILVKKKAIISPIVSTQNGSAFQVSEVKTKKETVKSKSTADIIRQLEEKLDQWPGTFSIYVQPLNGGQTFGVNESTVITAASINKIPIIAALYYLADSGEIDLEKIIVPQPADIQNYGTGVIQYQKEGTPYSLKTLARLMMEKSDNTAAFILTSRVIGIKKLQGIVDSWGLLQTDLTVNTTSVKDQAIVMEKIFRNEIVPKALTSELLGFMDKTDFDDRINLGLPEGVAFYHKSGDQVNKIHDVGIVDIPGKSYYIGIMTTDMSDVELTKTRMGEISKLIYEFQAL